MPKVQVFDPPMCCSTGVCGPDVDPALVGFAADLDWLASQGVELERFNLAQDPAAFVGNPAVVGAMRGGNDVLPMVLVDGRIAAQGRYPARQELAALVGLEAPNARPQATRGCGCTPSAAAPVSSSGPGSKKCC